jgi:hypothetical protein
MDPVRCLPPLHHVPLTAGLISFHLCLDLTSCLFPLVSPANPVLCNFLHALCPSCLPVPVYQQHNKMCLVSSTGHCYTVCFRAADSSPCFTSLLLSLSMVQQTLVGQGLLIIQASHLHSDTQHSVVLLWTTDQPDRHICLTTHNTCKTQTSIPPCEVRTRNPSKQAAADSCHRLGGHRDRPSLPVAHKICYTISFVGKTFSSASCLCNAVGLWIVHFDCNKVQSVLS